MRLDRVRLDETAKAREIIDPHAHALSPPSRFSICSLGIGADPASTLTTAGSNPCQRGARQPVGSQSYPSRIDSALRIKTAQNRV
jgi:hypothetical protein